MFAIRLIAATVATVALMLIVLVATRPEPRESDGTIGFAPQPARPVSTKALFIEHCARCHGETGDGNGTTELERPARSFMAGGYAYGNTIQAVMRTLTYGIPGTPMPAFGESLTDQQRSSLAIYVIGLGPPSTTSSRTESVLAVTDRPLVVNGMMDDPTAAGEREPRCVVIGFPNGTSFQYRHTGAALLAVRQGDFLDRADWRDGGGAPLRALGKTSWVADDGARGASTFERASDGAALTRALRRVASAASGDEVVLTFDLLDETGSAVGAGEERVSFVEANGAPVAIRTIRATDGVDAIRLASLADSKRVGGLETGAAGDALVAATPVATPGVRVLAHASRWTGDLTEAVERSIGRLP